MKGTTTGTPELPRGNGQLKSKVGEVLKLLYARPLSLEDKSGKDGEARED